MKQCGRCGETKSLDMFHAERSSKDGRRRWCKPCVREYQRTWRAETSEDRKEAAKRWYSENTEHRKNYYRAWRERNPEYSRERYRRNPDAILEHCHKRRAIEANATTVVLRKGWRSRLIDFYGKQCMFPGCSASRVTVDHVVPLARGGTHEPQNFQLLCGSHNSAKNATAVDYRNGRIFTDEEDQT